MLSICVGIALVTLVTLDLFWTTLTTRGSGFLTQWISFGLCRLLALLHRLWGSRNPLLIAGPLTLVVLGLCWIVTLWLGWSLILSGLFDPIVSAQTGRTATGSELVYYVGFTLSTLGVGDFRPQGIAAQVLTCLAAFNGLVLVTLIITYAIPVVSAAIARRQLAFSIALLGETPVGILKNTWSGTDFKRLESTLERLEALLLQCTEQRLAYPVVDYFYSRKAAFSLSFQLVVLDEALLLATAGLERQSQPDRFVVGRVRQIIAYYLDCSAPQLPSKPVTEPAHSFRLLASWVRAEKGELSLKSQDEFEFAAAPFAERRRDLHRLIVSDGWSWDFVTAP